MCRKLMFLILLLAFGLTSAAHAATIIWVSDAYDDNADGEPDDQPWMDFLEANGYTVDASLRYQQGRTLDDDKIAALNAADLVIVSRNSDSASYANNATEISQWSSITAPLILQSVHCARNSRWLWVNTTSVPNVSDASINIIEAGHPIFAGIPDGTQLLDGDVGPTTFVGTSDVGNGVLLAAVEGTGETWIIEWEMESNSILPGQITGGPRLILCSGTCKRRLLSAEANDLTPEGEQLFLNASMMLGGARTNLRSLSG
jgi:hypothetical protein